MPPPNLQKDINNFFQTQTAGMDAAALETMIADNGRIMREPARQLLLRTGLLAAAAPSADNGDGDSDTLTVAPREPFALLDHACGTGPVVAALLEAHDAGGVVPHSRVLCADFSAALLDALRQRIAARGWQGIETALLDAQETDLPAASFSHITLNFAMHIIPAPARVLADAHRLLRPGGTLGFTVWADANEGLTRDLRYALTGFPFPTPSLDLFPAAANGLTDWVTEAGLAAELDRFNHAAATTTTTTSAGEAKEEAPPRLVDLEVRTCRYAVRVDGPEHYLRMFGHMVQWATTSFWDEETRARAREGGLLERHIVQRMREAHGDGGWDQEWTYIVATCKKPL